MMPRKRVGLKEVAALAGTSTATVSRILNGATAGSSALRQRVLAAAQELRYEPNLRARGLRQQSSSTVGLIIPSLLNAYYTALADTAGQLLAEAGYSLLLASSRDDPDIERNVLRDMVGYDVAGLIWVPTTSDQDLLDYLEVQRVPVVSIVRSIGPERVDTVVFEDFKGSRAATQHLLDVGHRRIGYIGGDETHSSNQARWQGYRAAMADAGLTVDSELVRLGVLRGSWGFVATMDLLHLASPPTAIFAASNGVMPGLMRALQHCEVDVPGDLSLICFDDIEWFSFAMPPITAVSVSLSELARTAVDLLFQRIAGPEASRSAQLKEISYELIVRSSTSAPFTRTWCPEQDDGNPQFADQSSWLASSVSAEGGRASVRK